MRLALVVTTYERPDALAAVLDSVARQRVAPAEIVVADDGSGPATRDVIAAFAARSAVPARVVSQPHEGFRLTRLRNLAIAATEMDYVAFVDGDMLLHPEFVADHLRLARRGFYTQGVRVRADAQLTSALIETPANLPGFWSPGLGGLRRAYLLRSPALASLNRTLANQVIAIKGCNQAFWRDDLVRVNGFNEAIEGWGPEDKELVARLENSGVRRQTLLFGGIALHLHHAPASRAALPANLAVLDATRRECKVRCERGLDAHLRSRARGAHSE
ncbi:MAG TPA: glycosyltransferase family 2 protein [Steroidobacteraceae bacterium]|jgi:glycosyltransferase involved in cell wall biosynthesis|nr:glycosyltransferase family 2 protein [Steroidobacteraceae bacterium]